MWWKERHIISRSLVYKKKYQLAYETAKNHSLSTGPEFSEAEWLSGWFTSFLNKPNDAVKHLKIFMKMLVIQ